MLYVVFKEISVQRKRPEPALTIVGFMGCTKPFFAPLQTGLDNEREEQEPDNGGRPKGNFRIVRARPEQRARSRVGRKGNGYADGGAQEDVARIMDAEIHTTEAE